MGGNRTTPKVSVCMPTYNYARYLPEAIESVLRQTFADFELIVLDDASADGTPGIVEPYSRRDRRIRFQRNPVNVGMVRNWNLCLREARGEYVKFLFGDDFLCSDRALWAMAEVLQVNPAVSLVASSRQVVDETSTPREVWRRFRRDGIREGNEIARRCLYFQENLIGEPSAVMFRRSQASRGFDERYRQIVDLEMWFHLLAQGRFAFLAEPLAAFRIHPAQQSRANEDTTASLDDTRLLLQDYVFRSGIDLHVGYWRRKILACEYAVRLWKGYRRGRIPRETAVEGIAEFGGIAGILPWYPCYKIHQNVRAARKRREWRYADSASSTQSTMGGCGPADP